jgi:hypothetical protein
MHALVGLVIVVISFFTLPVKFLANSWRELSDIGRAGRVDVDQGDNLPLLSWVLVLGRALVAIGAVLIYLFIILAAAASEGGGAAAILAIIFGPLVSLVFIWIYGLFMEILSLQILVVRNTRKTYEALGGETSAPPMSPRAPVPGGDPDMLPQPIS